MSENRLTSTPPSTASSVALSARGTAAHPATAPTGGYTVAGQVLITPKGVPRLRGAPSVATEGVPAQAEGALALT